MDRLRPKSGFPYILRLLLPVMLGTALLSSCVSVPDGSEPSVTTTGSTGNDEASGSFNTEETESSISSSISSATPEGDRLKFDIFSLERHSADLLVLKMRITNTGQETAHVFRTLADPEGEMATPDGVSLVDMQNNKRYMPFTLTDGETCHCSNWRGQEKLAPGGNIDIWAAFPSPPESVELVAVTTPATPDFLDIPITEATSPDSAIVDTPTSEPRVLDLRAFQDDMDGNSSRTESAEETSIMLSSDVLFGLNEATLTEAAEEALRNVAEEINSSSGTTIQVNGYTDDTGSDSINNPLSQKRAEAVASRLEELVTRDGITFEVSGHGSADPVGDNSTEEGRAKNRRVTVTFTK